MVLCISIAFLLCWNGLLAVDTKGYTGEVIQQSSAHVQPFLHDLCESDVFYLSVAHFFAAKQQIGPVIGFKLQKGLKCQLYSDDKLYEATQIYPCLITVQIEY